MPLGFDAYIECICKPISHTKTCGVWNVNSQHLPGCLPGYTFAGKVKGYTVRKIEGKTLVEYVCFKIKSIGHQRLTQAKQNIKACIKRFLSHRLSTRTTDSKQVKNQHGDLGARL